MHDEKTGKPEDLIAASVAGGRTPSAEAIERVAIGGRVGHRGTPNSREQDSSSCTCAAPACPPTIEGIRPGDQFAFAESLGVRA